MADGRLLSAIRLFSTYRWILINNMKQFLLSTALVMSAASVMAAGPFASDVTSGASFTGMQVRQAAKTFKGLNSIAREAAEDDGIGEPVTTPPDGKRVDYSNRGDAYFTYDNGIYIISFDYRATHFIECDNGDVYIWNPISQLPTNSYLKGHRDGNVITVNFPQLLFKELDGGRLFTYYANKLVEADGTDGKWMFVDKTDNRLTYVLEDGEWLLDLPTDVNTVLGLTDEEDYWLGYGEGDVIFAPFTHELLQLPAGLETHNWAFSQGGEGRWVDVAFDNEDVYIKGMFKMTPDAWIKGKLQGDEIVFESGQYVGVANGNYGFFMGAGIQKVLNPETASYEDVDVLLDKVVFKYDKEKKEMTTETVCVLNVGYEYYGAMERCSDIKIGEQSELSSYVPRKPTFISFSPWNDDYDYFSIIFDLPMLNVNNEVLNPDNMYYEIFYDGNLKTIEPGPFSDYKAMTQIPFMFTDGFDIWYNQNKLSEHAIYMYDYDFDVIGVVSIYKDGEKEYRSEMMTYFKNSVESVGTEGNVVSEKWFDLSGRQVVNPENGIYLRVVRYDDNTQKTFKVCVR